MKYKKIVLAGGNGYLGTVLANYYKGKAGEIVILSRHEKETEHNIRTVVWDGKTWGKWAAELVNADILINLHYPGNDADRLSQRNLLKCCRTKKAPGFYFTRRFLC